MIVDGKAIAADILARTKARAGKLASAPRVIALVANETPATASYLKIKSRFASEAGCQFEIQKFPEDVTAAALRTAAATTNAAALIIQLPLPSHIDPRDVCDAIPGSKDADVLSGAARELFATGALATLLPPVVAAIQEILVREGVVVQEKNAVVIGEGWLVGKPAAAWLMQQGAQVTVVTEASENFAAALRAADLIISGAGAPALIKPDMIKEGVVIIDAGTSESDGALMGDADPACAEKCALFTPVPGGVGPIAVACLFQNAVTLAERVAL
ncbi:MAG TPA: bifunctional 5,10-methylenetetrahydrofolate dehydrogenase/5,10-methenyltetrahydrofolate cyclohydrolase [Candidatus Paceibacterota bacterium]|nr:bifunctional 5,10-methylenetetrahydrofolate dehydrogenase/5,10-methenyltetrahydrofolate cyclohydrolase [Candidatus Paceibacterota bacterium]